MVIKTNSHAAVGRLRRRMRRPKCALAALLIAFYGVAPLAAQTPADIAQATRDLAESLDLQTKFPTAQTPADIARETRDLAESPDLQTKFPTAQPEEKESAKYLDVDTVRVLLWIAVIAGAGLLAYFVRDALPAFGFAGRPRWDDRADGAGVSATGGNDATRVAADELASQGRFVEAMHVLLLVGLDEMRMRLDLRFADSLTSREIVSRSNAPADAKAALRDIIRSVERAYFGDHPAGETDYDACRRSFLALGSALQAGGGA
jgi:Domain of unknown function (DUF4129)